MRKARALGATAALLWIMSVAPIGAVGAQTPSDAFAAGTAAFADADFALALMHFEAALEGGLDGPAIHYNIGVCRYKLERYSDAESAFALIAERYPDMQALAEYNLGLVALKQDDARRAEEYFRAALVNSDDETIRYLARQQLGPEREETSDVASRTRWLALVDARLGYDDNVLLLADEIPLPDGQSAESSFVELWGLISGRLSSDGGFRFDGNLYALQYPEASMFDQTVLHLSAPYEWSTGAWRGEAGPHLSWTTIDGGILDRRLGIGATISRSIAAGTSLGFRYVHDEVDEGERRYAFFAGDRDWLEVRLDRRGEQGRLTFAHAIERNDRTAATVSPRRNKLTVRYRHQLPNDWLLDVQGSIRDSRYDKLAVPRDEDLKELLVGVTRTMPEGWQVGGTVSSASNDSNVETVAYRRNRLSLGVTKQF